MTKDGYCPVEFTASPMVLLKSKSSKVNAPLVTDDKKFLQNTVHTLIYFILQYIKSLRNDIPISEF